MIAEAQARGDERVRLADTMQLDGTTTRVEVRFGAAARSEAMPAGVPTEICQVDIDTGNTAMVEEFAHTSKLNSSSPRPVPSAAAGLARSVSTPASRTQPVRARRREPTQGAAHLSVLGEWIMTRCALQRGEGSLPHAKRVQTTIYYQLTSLTMASPPQSD